MAFDNDRMVRLWYLLEAAETRFCWPGSSLEDALHSFSMGLRAVMTKAGLGVDIVGAKLYFRRFLRQSGYQPEDRRDSDTPSDRLSTDNGAGIPDGMVILLGKDFPPLERKPTKDGPPDHWTQHPPIADDEKTRSLIDSLIADTKLYSTSKAIKDLLAFAVRMRHIAPFNAMLLNIQKPGLSYAATSRDWLVRFGRTPKPRARPMIILRNFGPVDFVYDVLDTEGRPLPDEAFSFPTTGGVPLGWFRDASERLAKVAIKLVWADEGDRSAGRIWISKNHGNGDRLNEVDLVVNENHPPATQFVTLAHELAHLYLGHLGLDNKRGVKGRTFLALAQREVEAEMVAYLIAKRSGISPRSERYLNTYKGALDQIDIHTVLQASNAIERLLRLPLEIWPLGSGPSAGLW